MDRNLEHPDGTVLAAYWARPATGCAGPGLVLVHDFPIATRGSLGVGPDVSGARGPHRVAARAGRCSRSTSVGPVGPTGTSRWAAWRVRPPIGGRRVDGRRPTSGVWIVGTGVGGVARARPWAPGTSGSVASPRSAAREPQDWSRGRGALRPPLPADGRVPERRRPGRPVGVGARDRGRRRGRRGAGVRTPAAPAGARHRRRRRVGRRRAAARRRARQCRATPRPERAGVSATIRGRSRRCSAGWTGR